MLRARTAKDGQALPGGNLRQGNTTRTNANDTSYTQDQHGTKRMMHSLRTIRASRYPDGDHGKSPGETRVNQDTATGTGNALRYGNKADL